MTEIKLFIGADPELFIQRNGHFLSAHFFKLGSKTNPRKTKHGFIHVDGMALECNVKPAETEDEFYKNTYGVLQDLIKEIQKADKTCRVVATPTANFGGKYLSKMPKEVVQLGCNPDFNAYTLEENLSPNPLVPFRTGAGHVHIGWTSGKDPKNPSHFFDCVRLTKELDYFLGLPSLMWDKDKQRRELYGKAGSFRPKPYGCEYRVLSNAWLRNEITIRNVFRNTVKAFRSLEKGRSLYEKYQHYAAETINSNDHEWAHKHTGLLKEISSW